MAPKTEEQQPHEQPHQLDASMVTVENGVPLDHGLPVADEQAPPPIKVVGPKKTHLLDSSVSKRPWYRRPRVLFTITTIVLLLSIGLAVVAVLLANGTIETGLGANTQAASGTTNTNENADNEPVATDAPPPIDDDNNNNNQDGNDGSSSTTEEPPAPTNDQAGAPEPTFDATPASSPPPTALPTALATQATTRTDPVSFYVMGDVPYAEWEELMLGQQMRDMRDTMKLGAEFVVHVGDMQKAVRTNCELTRFTHVANILASGPLPTFVQVGDNDYLDCPDKGAAWDSYLQTFVSFEDTKYHSIPVERWTELMNVPLEWNLTRQVAKPEMFAFALDGVLFIGFTLLNMDLGQNEPPDDLFYERLADSKAWVTKQLDQHDNIRGTVMFSHAMVTPDIRPFFEDLREIFFDAGVYTPVLYIHGDGHDFSVNTDFGNTLAWPQLTRIEVDQGGYADPLLITVALNVADGYVQPLTADDSGMQYVLSNGLFLLDRQNGRYPDSVNPNN